MMGGRLGWNRPLALFVAPLSLHLLVSYHRVVKHSDGLLRNSRDDSPDPARSAANRSLNVVRKLARSSRGLEGSHEISGSTKNER